LEERLNTLARAESVDVMRMRRQLAFDRLLARLFHAPGSPWLLKGGYVMELRIQRARTTRDLDLGYKSILGGKMRELLQQAAAVNMKDFFSFLIGESTLDLEAAPYGDKRFPVETRVDGRTFIKFHVDVALGDDGLEPNETMVGRDWLGFAGLPAPRFIAIPAPQHFAEKLHAYTQVRKVPNTRVKDLVDMVLLIRMGALEPARVHAALEKTFIRRNAHAMPMRLEPPPPTWATPFKAMAEECGLNMDYTQAFAIVSEFHRSLDLDQRNTGLSP
jgi:hypothetical protein